MDEKQAQRVILCTPENVDEMRSLIKSWPKLNALVRGLQAQGVFPGLRGLQVTLTGTDQCVAKGLGAVMPENAPTDGGRQVAQ